MTETHFCPQCGETVGDGRYALGYKLCLPCGDKQARGVRRTVVPLNKSNYTLITNPDELAWLNPKRIGG